MNHTTGVVVVALILATVLLVALYKLWYVEGEIRTPFGSSRLRGQKSTQTYKEGIAQVDSIRGGNVTIGDIKGAVGSDVRKGKVSVTNITSENNIEIGNLTGLEQRESGK